MTACKLALAFSISMSCIVACSSDDGPPPFVATSGTSSSSSSSSSSGSVPSKSSSSSSSSSGAATTTTGGGVACDGHVVPSVAVTSVTSDSAIAKPTGGTIADGYYVLDTVTRLNATGDSAMPWTGWVQVSGGSMAWTDITFCVTGPYTTSGTQLTIDDPVNGSATLDYTALTGALILNRSADEAYHFTLGTR